MHTVLPLRHRRRVYGTSLFSLWLQAVHLWSLERPPPKMTSEHQCSRISAEVHAGWCPPGTSNPAGLALRDRSVRFRHTSANFYYEPPPAAQAEAVPRRDGSKAAGTHTSGFASPRRAAREPQAQAAQTQETGLGARGRVGLGIVARPWRRTGPWPLTPETCPQGLDQA